MAASASFLAAEVGQEMDLSRPVFDLDPPGPAASADKEPESDNDGWEEDAVCKTCGYSSTANLPACEMCWNCCDRRHRQAEKALSTPTEVAPLCWKCRCHVHEVSRATVYGKGRTTLICEICSNAMTMLAKKLDVGKMGEASLELSCFTQVETEAFWQQTAGCVDGSGALSWKAVRNLVCKTFSEPKLPLFVWGKKGFDVKQIRRHGKPSYNPLFGEVWRVPLKTTSRDEVILVYNFQGDFTFFLFFSWQQSG